MTVYDATLEDLAKLINELTWKELNEFSDELAAVTQDHCNQGHKIEANDMAHMITALSDIYIERKAKRSEVEKIRKANADAQP